MVNKYLKIVSFALLFFACSSHIRKTDYSWYQNYSNNQLDSAEIILDTYLSKYSGDISSLCYYAETLRRRDKLFEADSIADIVLDKEPCNSFALCIKGDIANPQFHVKSPLNNEQLAYSYYLKATECDSTYGDAWEVIWIKAMKNGDTHHEKLAFIRLYETEFYTKSTLALARWYLRDVPENAVLITNGDMDTYPLLAVQVNEKFRPDITIVNASMLNMKWYFELLCDRHTIPTGFSAEEFNELNHRQENDNTIITISHQILKKWYDLFELDEFSRPLCFAVTVDETYFKSFSNKMELCGPFNKLVAETPEQKADPVVIFNSLKGINPEEFTEPYIGDRVTSPVLLKGKQSRLFDQTIFAVAMRAAIAFSKASMDSSAYEVLDWIDHYLEVVDANQEYRGTSLQCRKAVMKGWLR